MDGRIIAAAALVLMFSAGFAFFGMGNPGEGPQDVLGFMRGMHDGNGTAAGPLMQGDEMPPCDGEACAPRTGAHRRAFEENRAMREALEIPEECRQAMQGEEASSKMEEIRSAIEERDFESAKELREELIELMPDGCALAQHSMPQKMHKQGREAPPTHEIPEECRQALESEDFSALMGELHSALESGNHELAAKLREEIKEFMPDGCAGFPLMHGVKGGSGCPFSEDEAS